ncbi:MAG TPA: PAS domain S-box protein [Thermoleophilaceae bacterium]|nr:PAS domain S-box protein [Thermoleophilaceae bacterium]
MGEPTPPIPAGEKRAESEHLAAIVRSSDVAILSKDENAVVTSWNEAAERLYGYTPAEMVGQPVALLLPPERHGEEMEIVRKIFAGERVEHYDTERVRKDGTRVAVSLTASPIHDAKGNVVGVATQARDISSTTVALREAEQRLEGAFMGAPIGIAVFSVVPESFGRIEQANAELARLYGYTMEELAEVGPGDLTHPDDAERERLLFTDLAEGRRASFALEKRNRHKDGSWIWVSLTVSLLEGEDPPRSALAHVLDVTERKIGEADLERARENLERSNAELDQFAYVASHDLKEPLILLSAYARMLAERYGDDLNEEGRTFLGHVRGEAGRMKTMIEDLLDYSRVETRAEAPAAVPLADSVETALRTLQPRIEESGAQIDVRPGLPVVEGSPAQFERLFRNLLSNAIKFRADAPPTVTVFAERAGDECIVSVQDNGIGIDPAKADRIFELFQRLHGQERYAGTGMGLAICKRIVERHGGRIWVEPAPGGGSIFRFGVPI